MVIFVCFNLFDKLYSIGEQMIKPQFFFFQLQEHTCFKGMICFASCVNTAVFIQK